MNTSGRSTCAVYAVISCLLWFIGLGLSACNSSDSGVESPAPGSPSSTPPVTPPPGAIASITINSPTQSATLAAGPVLVTFDIQNSPVAPSTAQPRMHFYIDSDPTVYTFYDGPGVAEDGALSGVRYQNVHTHFVHWKSGNSIQLNAL